MSILRTGYTIFKAEQEIAKPESLINGNLPFLVSIAIDLVYYWDTGILMTEIWRNDKDEPIAIYGPLPLGRLQ